MFEYRVFVGLLFSILLLSSGCRNGGGDSADPSELVMNFKVSYDGEALVFQEDSLLYRNSQALIFEVFKIFISDAKMYSSDGSGSIELFEVEMLDFTNMTSNSLAENGLDVLIRSVPSGNYSRLDFGIGVNPELNITSPSDYGGNHPLSNQSMYINVADGYFFWNLSGKADLDGDGDFSDLNFNYFNKGNEHYIPKLKFYDDFALIANKTEILTFELDLKKLLDGLSGHVDIQNFPNSTEDNTNMLSELFNENFEHAWTLKP